MELVRAARPLRVVRFASPAVLGCEGGLGARWSSGCEAPQALSNLDGHFPCSGGRGVLVALRGRRGLWAARLRRGLLGLVAGRHRPRSASGLRRARSTCLCEKENNNNTTQLHYDICLVVLCLPPPRGLLPFWLKPLQRAAPAAQLFRGLHLRWLRWPPRKRWPRGPWTSQWRAVGRAKIESMKNRSLSPLEAAQVGLIWWMARRTAGMAHGDPFEPLQPSAPGGGGEPMAASPTAGGRKVKLAHLIEQGNDTETAIVKSEDIAERRPKR